MEVTSQPADSNANYGNQINVSSFTVDRNALGQLTGMFIVKEMVVSPADAWDFG